MRYNPSEQDNCGGSGLQSLPAIAAGGVGVCKNHRVPRPVLSKPDLPATQTITTLPPILPSSTPAHALHFKTVHTGAGVHDKPPTQCPQATGLQDDLGTSAGQNSLHIPQNGTGHKTVQAMHSAHRLHDAKYVLATPLHHTK